MIKQTLLFLLCTTAAYGLKNGSRYLVHKDILIMNGMEGEMLAKDFKTFDAAKGLVLSSSTVDRIEDNAFCGAPFTEIVLTNNFLPRLTKSMFSKCAGELTALIVDGNPSLTMDVDIINNMPRLEKLEINSQPLKILTKEYFRGLPSLKNLEILNSDLQTIEAGAFDELSNLKELWLAHNNFRNLNGLLRNLKHLEEVQVVDNKLEEFPLVEGLVSLKKFDLTNNKITKIESSRVRNLPKSVVVDVSQNPISCESLKKLREELKDDYKIIYEDNC